MNVTEISERLLKLKKYTWHRFVDPWKFLEFWLFKSLHKTLSPSGGRQISTGKNIRIYPQAIMMMLQTAGNKCVKITKHWSKYLGSTPWLESPNVQVAWDLGSQHLQEDPSILTGKLSMMSLVISLKVWVNGWIDAIIYHYQDCNELALLLLGSGNRRKWDLRSNSEVTIAELESYTMWWGVDDFQFNDKSTFGQLWYIDDKSWTIALPRTVCDELLGPMVFNTVDSRAKELGGNP